MSIFFGDSSIGHYISYIKLNLNTINNKNNNKSNKNNEKRWYECSDDDVNPIDGNIEGIFSNNNNNNSYVQLALFHKIC